MASPFDFSSFLMTPPIPNAPSNHPLSQSNLVDDSNPQNAGSDNQLLAPSSAATSGANPGTSSARSDFNSLQVPSSSTLTPSQNANAASSSGKAGPEASNSGGGTTGNTSNSSRLASLDERDYGLDPSAFNSVSFQMPSFLTATSTPGQFGDVPNLVDPSAFRSPAAVNTFPSTVNVPATVPPASLQVPTAQSTNHSGSGSNSTGKNKYQPDTRNPVYGIYGSSVISVNPDPSPFKLQLNNAQPPVRPPSPNESRGNTPDFDPTSLGLPAGNQLFPQPLPGLYSSSGFDMLGVLARVVARPCPQINIGPVDTSCSFVVVDARRYDMPIVFASETFTNLTGYTNSEIVGRNCRFLQAPDGRVAMGSRRKYTDGNAVYHLKTHIQSGKESQASIINYRKDGSPFINLVTVVPITWDTDEIAYFVGFQVDLVEQPNAILEKMRNGTYVVNYSLLPTNAAPIPVAPAAPTEPPEETTLPADVDPWSEQKPVKIVNPVASAGAVAAAANSSMQIAPELLEVMGQIDDDLDDDAAKKKWNKMLLDHTGDFVHVLSLKGSFLYVSPSVRTMLEYDSADLIGKTIQSVCHPSDIVPVMRELKEASTVTHPIIHLLYRFRRKHSGYIWIEAQGKLYLEQSKSRKCVILVGRERPVYKLAWSELNAAGGLGDREFWSKISPDGMFLYNTPTVKTVLGQDADNIKGTSMFELIEPEKASELTKALRDAASGTAVRLRHKLKNSKGQLVDVITNFFPNSQPLDPSKKPSGILHPSIIAQTNEYASEMRRRATLNTKLSALPPPSGLLSPAANSPRPAFLRAHSSAIHDMIVTTPEVHSDDSGSPVEGSNSGSGGASGSDSSAPSTFSAIPSTYKTLLQNGNMQSDNLFDELDTTRATSWQYELHQLKLTNKKLKEELHMLQAAKRKRRRKQELQAQGPPTGSGASSTPSAPPTIPGVKTCANCGRTDSPEWRVGPSGARNLCNACGLRWAKATRNARQQSGTPSSGTTSSANSDMDAAANANPSPYYQHVAAQGPFRPQLQHASSSYMQGPPPS